MPLQHFLVIWLCIGCIVASANVPVKSYTIDLNLPADQRWNQVATDYAHFAPQLQTYVKLFLPHWAEDYAWKVGELVAHLIPDEFAQELRSFERITGIAYGELVLLNVLYDLTAFDRASATKACTSIVARDGDGAIWHGRNLDYDMQPLLKNLTFLAKFVQDGVLQYEGLSFAFYVGVLTGQRVHAYTISVNERFAGSIIFNILMAIYTRGHHPLTLAIRQCLHTYATYDSALDYVSHVRLIAPAYVIVAGANNGAVVTRDRWSARDVWTLTDADWFRVETNYDHWRPTPGRDKRRDTANKLMRNITQMQLTPAYMRRVLATRPILNSLTIYTTVMSPNQPSAIEKYSEIIT